MKLTSNRSHPISLHQSVGVVLGEFDGQQLSQRFRDRVIRSADAEAIWLVAISENAQRPVKASGDAGSMEQHKLSGLVVADRHLSAEEVAKSTRRGLRFNEALGKPKRLSRFCGATRIWPAIYTSLSGRSNAMITT